MENWNLNDADYVLSAHLAGATLDEAQERVRAALADAGFGVLTEIDLAATLKAKLGVEVPSYRILGACNPPLAHEAVIADANVGALLPCNVCLIQVPDGVAVRAVDPVAMFAVVGDAGVEPLAAAVRAKLEAALGSLG